MKYILLGVIMAWYLPPSAAAVTFENLCLPGDACTGHVPIVDSQFYGCEDNCQMENPTLVRGMDATLYDVTCRGDFGSRYFRMMLLKAVEDGVQVFYTITAEGAERLVPCSR